MLRTAPFLLVAATLVSGCLTNRPTESDPEEIAARYAHRMGTTTCSSWLRSHKTGFLYCASPAFVAQPPPVYELIEEVPCPSDAAGLQARGEETYNNVCAACHQANGEGLGDYPPLKGAGEFYGDAKNHAKIIVHGLNGEITVLGKTYNSAMAPHGHLSDCDIAAVATYERNSWGNADGPVSVADVAAVR